MAVDYMQHASKDGLTLVLYRGEDMVLLAFDLDENLRKPDFVGFGIQYQIGNDPKMHDVFNFLTFKALREKDEAANPPAPPVKAKSAKAKPAKAKSSAKKSKKVAAAAPAVAAPAAPPAPPRDFSFKASLRSPFQSFRWAHVPSVPINGPVTYTVSAMFWQGPDKPPVARATVSATIDVGSDTRAGFLNVGFTRGFASSQAYVRRFQNTPDILPGRGKKELEFDVAQFGKDDGPYPWLGFEARRMMFAFLDELIADPTVKVDVFAYDFSDPEIVVDRLVKLGPRLRIIIDTSGKHGGKKSEESDAEKMLKKSAGKDNVKRHKFVKLQHNKVIIAKRNDKAFAVFTGSTNFALRGLYIQNNNALLFRDPDIAGFYADAFQAAFPKPDGFKKNGVAGKWFEKQSPNGLFKFAFSPHSDATLSMKPIADAVNAAQDSVMYAIAFYGAQTGLAGEAIRAIDSDKLHVMGVADKPGSAKPKKAAGKAKKAKKGAKGAKPKKDTTTTIVQLPGRGRVPLSPAALTAELPPPFHSEWSGGSGVRMHHKFVICDFNGKNPVVFTGSSNLATGGEQGNGDNLIEIRDPKVVVAYAVQAVSIFDHYAFRVRMKGAKKKPEAMDLFEPPAAGEKPWWDAAFGGDPGKTGDRELFSHVAV